MINFDNATFFLNLKWYNNCLQYNFNMKGVQQIKETNSEYRLEITTNSTSLLIKLITYSKNWKNLFSRDNLPQNIKSAYSIDTLFAKLKSPSNYKVFPYTGSISLGPSMILNLEEDEAVVDQLKKENEELKKKITLFQSKQKMVDLRIEEKDEKIKKLQKRVNELMEQKMDRSRDLQKEKEKQTERLRQIQKAKEKEVQRLKQIERQKQILRLKELEKQKQEKRLKELERVRQLEKARELLKAKQLQQERKRKEEEEKQRFKPTQSIFTPQKFNNVYHHPLFGEQPRKQVKKDIPVQQFQLDTFYARNFNVSDNRVQYKGFGVNQLLLKNRIPFNRSFKFFCKIIKTERKQIYVGVVDRRQKLNMHSHMTGNAICLEGVGKIYGKNGMYSTQATDKGFEQKQVISVEVNLSQSSIIWRVGQAVRAFCVVNILLQSQRDFAPFIQFSRYGDIVQVWCE